MGGNTTVARYRRIARIIQAKGLAGGLVTTLVGGSPLCVEEGLRVWVVPPDHDLVRETRLCSVARSGQGGDRLLLHLDGVADRTTALRLQGRCLLARAEDVDDAQAAAGAAGAGATGVATGAAAAADAVGSALGLSVIDETEGLLGTIVEERLGTAQTLWVVDGPLGEVLIPAVDEFIRARSEEMVRVCLPQGLLGLNP